MRPSVPWGLLAAVLLVGAPAGAWGDDWPMLGRDRTRNAVSPEKNPPTDWQAEERDDQRMRVKPARNIRWTAELGTRTVGTPVVAGGLVWVGTNNSNQRDPRLQGDAGVLRCFRANGGKFLYQHLSPRLPNRLHDISSESLSSAPLVEGDRLWFTTNRWVTICLDIGPLRRGTGEPREVWRRDLIKELGVFPYAPGPCRGAMQAAAVAGPYRDHVYVVTANGTDDTGRAPAPRAPSLVCLHKDTGKVVWKDASPGAGILEGQWASPLVVEVKGRGQVIMAQGDGWVRSFDALSGKLVWKFDTNAKGVTEAERNDVAAAPVFHQDRVFVAGGRHSAFPARRPWLYCLDATKEGDISLELEAGPGKARPNPNAGVVWRYGGVEGGRAVFSGTLSSVAIHSDLVIAPVHDGYVHCLDARTGKKHWTQDVEDSICGSPLIVDGKIYLGTEGGIVWILALAQAPKVLAQHEMPAGLRSSLVFANGVLYVATDDTLYAIGAKK